MKEKYGVQYSMSSSHAVGHGFAAGLVIPKTIIYMVQNASLLATQALGRVYVWQCNQIVKCRVVCGTDHVDMHYKDLLGSIARVGYCIPVLDCYLVLHGLQSRKKSTKWIKQSMIMNKEYYILLIFGQQYGLCF